MQSNDSAASGPAVDEIARDSRRAGMDQMMKIPVTLDVILGTARMAVSDFLKLDTGSVITLDRKVGEPVDIAVNGKKIARGEVVVLEEGNRLGVSLTEILTSHEF